MYINISNPTELTEQLYSQAKDIRLLKKQLDSALLKIARSEFEVLMKLSLTAEKKVMDTSAHIYRIGYMTELLCLLLKEPPEFCFLMRLAAPLHDVGGIGIPDHLLHKPGKYDDAERHIMNQHPIIGANILNISNDKLFQLAAEIAISHHEKYDGSGYPYGLTGENIPFAGRIVAIVDFYDSISNNHSYGDNNKTLEMLLAQKGSHFDPDMIDVFIKHYQKFINLKTKVNSTHIDFDSLISLDLVKQVI